MGRLNIYKQEFSFDERLKESQSIIMKYPDRVPVTIEKYSRTDLSEFDNKNKSNGLYLRIIQGR